MSWLRKEEQLAGTPKENPVTSFEHIKSSHRVLLADEYRTCWKGGKIRDTFQHDAIASAAMALVNKPLYDAVEASTLAPWWVIACLHHMEADSKPDCGIANGQPWSRVTTIVPKGRGPFPSFIAEAAYSLTQYQKPEEWGQTFHDKDWKDPAWTFWFLESWNGFGNRLREGVTPPHASAYVFSGFELNGEALYLKGKDTSDYNFDPEATSSQVGCMAFLKALEKPIGASLFN